MSEHSDAFYRVAIAELFGDDWRPDRPLDSIGGLIGTMLEGGLQSVGQYENIKGRIAGIRESIELYRLASQRVNEPGTRN
ncbi:MAG TPA: hypothetical protein VMW56_14445 [Candidatus Margulisiibacteriota bacterium]|nr:hypothetical protein [Candidatus Margulisiibacteriota bacterium]